MTREELNQVVVTDANVTALERTHDELRSKLAQLDDNFKIRIKSLISNINYDYYSARELQIRMNSASTPLELRSSSARYFMVHILKPAIELGWISPLYPDITHHPKQKYKLTELGITLKAFLSE